MKPDARIHTRGAYPDWSGGSRLLHPHIGHTGGLHRRTRSGGVGLYGLRVLLVQDESVMAMVIEDLLSELGCVVVDVAGAVSQGLESVAGGGIDAAILDLDVDGEPIFPVADALTAREVPFVFSTSEDPTLLCLRYPGSQTIAKPYDADALACILADCCLEASAKPRPS
jgi:CheY-like chemotaxis protein